MAKKPVNQGGGPNYLGKQKEVKAPLRWKSSPDHPEAHLAYITDAEQELLIKKNMHGGLEDGKPNKGPYGIPSLQGDLGGYSAPAGGKSGDASGKGGGGSSSYKDTDYYKMMTGTGTTATSPTGDTYRSKNIAKGAVPEYVNTPDGLKYVGSKTKFVGRSLFNPSGYRGTVGTSPTFVDRLFRRNNPMGTITTRINPYTGQLEYYSEEEDVGEAKPGFGGRILGGIASLLTGVPFVGSMIGSAIDKYKPKGYFESLDPSEQRRLNALNITPYNEQKISLTNDVPMESLTMANFGKTSVDNNITPLSIFNTNYPGANKGIPYTDAFTQAGTMDYLNDYTNQLETGQPITNDEQMFVDNEIANLRFP